MHWLAIAISMVELLHPVTHVPSGSVVATTSQYATGNNTLSITSSGDMFRSPAAIHGAESPEAMCKRRAAMAIFLSDQPSATCMQIEKITKPPAHCTKAAASRPGEPSGVQSQ